MSHTNVDDVIALSPSPPPPPSLPPVVSVGATLAVPPSSPSPPLLAALDTAFGFSSASVAYWTWWGDGGITVNEVQ